MIHSDLNGKQLTTPVSYSCYGHSFSLLFPDLMPPNAKNLCRGQEKVYREKLNLVNGHPAFLSLKPSTLPG